MVRVNSVSLRRERETETKWKRVVERERGRVCEKERESSCEGVYIYINREVVL